MPDINACNSIMDIYMCLLVSYIKILHFIMNLYATLDVGIIEKT